MTMGIKVFISVILVVIMTSLTDARSVPESAANSTMLRKSVEVVVVVDRYAHGQWRQWQQGASDEEDRERMTQDAITQFVHATFCSANLICKGLEAYNVFLDLRIDHIRVVTDEDVVPPMADGVSVMNENASWGFHQWLVRNGIEFDHALFLTGLDLSAEDSNGHEGYAYMNTMCRSDSVSVVENIINGIPAVVVAHEVSHSLSAKHDGGRNNRCNSTSGYIMNANNIGTSPNHWNYSTCSGHDIANKLQQLQDSYDCLSGDSTRSPPVEPPYLGQLYSGDQLCQMSHGNHSYVCRHLYNRPQSRSVCQILWCLVNQTYCAGVAPVDGLPCGAGKRCLAGQCVPFDDVAEEVTDECFAGDKPGFAWRNQTCGEVVSSYTSLCLDEWYQDFCCQTCLGFRTGNDACPYGDAFSSCSRWHCSTRWASQCCQTCPR